jgi:hypothetical protein
MACFFVSKAFTGSFQFFAVTQKGVSMGVAGKNPVVSSPAACATRAAPVPGAVSPEEALRFAAVARQIIGLPLTETQGQAGIGTLREKRLHLALKTYICPDVSCHEQRLSSGGRRSTMVADVLTREGQIYEIQTGSFYPLRKKISWYLSHTDCSVTVVHPLPAVKYLSWISPADGQILSRRKSPKRGKVTDVASQLYWLSDFVGDARFSLCLLFLDMEEYRFQDGWGRDGKRGSNRYERFPTALRGRVDLATPAQYAPLPALCPLHRRPIRQGHRHPGKGHLRRTAPDGAVGGVATGRPGGAQSVFPADRERWGEAGGRL